MQTENGAKTIYITSRYRRSELIHLPHPFDQGKHHSSVQRLSTACLPTEDHTLLQPQWIDKVPNTMPNFLKLQIQARRQPLAITNTLPLSSAR